MPGADHRCRPGGGLEAAVSSATVLARLQAWDRRVQDHATWGRAWCRVRAWVRLAGAAVQRFTAAQGMRHGAAVAFYAVFSIAPVLVVVTGVMVWFIGDERAQGTLLEAVRQLIGPREAETMARMLSQRPALDFSFQHADSMASWLALGSTLLGASGVFVELKGALHAMLGEPARPFNWWYLLQVRLVAVGVVVGCGFLLSVAMVLQGVSLVALHFVADRWSLLAPVLEVAEFAWSWGVIALLFTIMLRWLPDIRLPWACAFGGALVSASLFMLGRWGISLYVAQTASQSALGAAGSFAALLVWIYWSSQIFLLGAAWAVVLRETRGSARAVPPAVA